MRKGIDTCQRSLQRLRTVRAQPLPLGGLCDSSQSFHCPTHSLVQGVQGSCREHSYSFTLDPIQKMEQQSQHKYLVIVIS